MGKNLGPYKAKLIEIAMQIAAKQYNLMGFTQDGLAAMVRASVEFTGFPDRDIALVLKAVENTVNSFTMRND